MSSASAAAAASGEDVLRPLPIIPPVSPTKPASGSTIASVLADAALAPPPAAQSSPAPAQPSQSSGSQTLSPEKAAAVAAGAAIAANQPPSPTIVSGTAPRTHRRGGSFTASSPFISDNNSYAVSERVSAERERAKSEREREAQRSIKISQREKLREIESIKAAFYADQPTTTRGGSGAAAASGAGASSAAAAADINSKHKRKVALLAEIHAAELRLEQFGRDTDGSKRSSLKPGGGIGTGSWADIKAATDAATAGKSDGSVPSTPNSSNTRDREKLREYERLMERQNAYTAELSEELQSSQLKLKQLLQWKKVAFEHVDILRAENDELNSKLVSAGETYSKLRSYRRLFMALSARSCIRIYQVKRLLRTLHHTFSRLLSHVQSDQNDESGDPKRHIFTLQAEIEEWLGISKRTNPFYPPSTTAGAAGAAGGSPGPTAVMTLAEAAAANLTSDSSKSQSGAGIPPIGGGSVKIVSIVKHLCDVEAVLHTAILELTSQKQQWRTNVEAAEARALELTTQLRAMEQQNERLRVEHSQVVSAYAALGRTVGQWQRRAEVSQRALVATEEREAKLLAKVSSLSRQNAYLQQQIRLLVHSGHVSHTIIHNSEQTKKEKAHEKRDADTFRELLRARQQSEFDRAEMEITADSEATADAANASPAPAPASNGAAAANDEIKQQPNGESAAAPSEAGAASPAPTSVPRKQSAGGQRPTAAGDFKAALASFHAHHSPNAAASGSSTARSASAMGSPPASSYPARSSSAAPPASFASITPSFLWKYLPGASAGAAVGSSGLSSTAPIGHSSARPATASGASPRRQKLKHAGPSYAAPTAASLSGSLYAGPSFAWSSTAPAATSTAPAGTTTGQGATPTLPPAASATPNPNASPSASGASTARNGTSGGSGSSRPASSFAVRSSAGGDNGTSGGDASGAPVPTPSPPARSPSPTRSASPGPQTRVRLLSPRVVMDKSGLDSQVKQQKIKSLTASPYFRPQPSAPLSTPPSASHRSASPPNSARPGTAKNKRPATAAAANGAQAAAAAVTASPAAAPKPTN